MIDMCECSQQSPANTHNAYDSTCLLLCPKVSLLKQSTLTKIYFLGGKQENSIIPAASITFMEADFVPSTIASMVA
jgi:hypothetical protein